MRATWFLTRWGNSPGGWSAVDGEGTIRIEATLGLGHIGSRAEALRVAAAELTRFADGQMELSIGIDPSGSGDVPYVDWGIGDLVDVDDGATAGTHRVIALTVAQDPQRPGRLIYVPQVGDVIDSEDAKIQRWSKKMINGTLGGASRVATPLSTFSQPSPPQSAPPFDPGEG